MYSLLIHNSLVDLIVNHQPNQITYRPKEIEELERGRREGARANYGEMRDVYIRKRSSMIIWLGIMKRISCSILRPRDAVACTDANNRKSKKRRSTNKIMYKSLLQNLLLPFSGPRKGKKIGPEAIIAIFFFFFCQLTSLTLRWFLKAKKFRVKQHSNQQQGTSTVNDPYGNQQLAAG